MHELDSDGNGIMFGVEDIFFSFLFVFFVLKHA